MTWGNRFRVWGGIVVIVAVVAVLTLVVNQRSRQAFSDNAEIAAQQSTVGSEYGGVVVRQYVEQGDVVGDGDPLFTVSSLDLQRDASNGLKPVSTSSYRIDATRGQVTFLSPAEGTVTALNAEQGTFVSGADMATITASGTQYVTAQFRLSAGEYGRIRIGGAADIELPNRDQLSGTVREVTVQTSGGVAETTVAVSVPDLRTRDMSSLNQPGSPVSVTLTLSDSGVLAGPTDALMGFLHRTGVR
jgi:multidrug resistance efflux pump